MERAGDSDELASVGRLEANVRRPDDRGLSQTLRDEDRRLFHVGDMRAVHDVTSELESGAEPHIALRTLKDERQPEDRVPGTPR